jgi:hypothetical protein
MEPLEDVLQASIERQSSIFAEQNVPTTDSNITGAKFRTRIGTTADFILEF